MKRISLILSFALLSSANHLHAQSATPAQQAHLKASNAGSGDKPRLLGRCQVTRWWSVRLVRTATLPGSTVTRPTTTLLSLRRSLRLCAQRDQLDPAGLPQSVQHRSE